MDRELLVSRNKAMAEAFHKTPLKHEVRRGLLEFVSHAPILPTRQRETERILLVRPDHIGDVLLTTPAIRIVRDQFPNAEIHALVGGWSANVLADNPDVDHILTLPFPGFNRAASEPTPQPYRLAVKSARHLRRIGYRSAIIFRPDHWWGALLTFLAGIPTRIGFDQADTLPFLTQAIPQRHQHAVEQNARLACALARIDDVPREQLKLRFSILDADHAWAAEMLHDWGIAPTRPLIAIHPGAGTWVKRWEDAKWAAVADALADQHDAAIIITGGEHEQVLAGKITALMRHTPTLMTGVTGLGGLAAIYHRARLVIGADSGPLHLAVAVGTPTVTLYGPADPVEFGSWGDSHKHQVVLSSIGCRPCRVLDWGTDDLAYHPCVREIGVSTVLEAARQAMNALPLNRE